jgi:SAM-dependent methyltransferase
MIARSRPLVKRYQTAGEPEFWCRLWLEAQASSPVARRERLGPGEDIEGWSRRAAAFARQSENAASRRRRQAQLDWLAERGALRPRFRVLDIGAGPGTFALLLAGRVREVVALEPASGMAAILEEKIKARRLSNLRVVRRTWQEIEPEEEGWASAFDLVFASMSPGVSAPRALESMLQVSRRFCYLSAWSGGRWGRWGRAREELWPRLFGGEAGGYPNDIFYPFGLLYALGFRPELRFHWVDIRLEMSSGEAEKELIGFFQRYAPASPRLRRQIASYVGEYSRGGLFRQESRQCQGSMLWEAR